MTTPKAAPFSGPRRSRTAARTCALALLCASLSLGACSSEPEAPAPPPPPPTFTTDAPSYEPYQWALLTLSSGDLPLKQQVQGTLDGSPLTLVATASRELLLVVPDDGKVGERVLSFSHGGVTYTGKVQVRAIASPIADPAAYTAGFVTETREALESALTRLQAHPEAAVRERVQPVLEEAQRGLAEKEQALSQLSDADRRALAYFLRANVELRPSPLRGSAGAAVAAARATASEACLEHEGLEQRACLLSEFSFGILELGRDVAMTFVSVTLVPTTGGWSLLGVGLFGFWATLDVFDVIEQGAALHTNVVATVNPALTTVDGDRSEDFTLESDEVDGSSGAVHAMATARAFSHGQPTPLRFTARYRNLQAGDTASGIDWVGPVARAVAEFNALVTEHLDARLALPFGAPTSERVLAEREQVQVSVVSNSAVRVHGVQGTGADLRVTFVSDETTSQDFVFEVLYTSGVSAPVRVRYAATLRPSIYKVAFVSGQQIPPSIQFSDGVEARFLLVLADGTPVPGFDASQLTVSAGTTAGIAVTGRAHSDSLGVTLTSAATGATETLFDVLYRGVRLQTVHGRIAPLEYTLELQTYHPDYSRMTAAQTLQPHGAFPTPNGLIQYFRVRYRGDYVAVGGFGLGVQIHSFYLKTHPPRAEDEEVVDYRLQFLDETNQRVVFFPLNVTLQNDAYRRIVGSTVQVSKRTGELLATYTFRADGTVVTASGATSNYTLFAGPGHMGASQYYGCATSELSYAVMGYVTNFPMTLDIPSSYIQVRADGTLGFGGCGSEDYTVQ